MNEFKDRWYNQGEPEVTELPAIPRNLEIVEMTEHKYTGVHGVVYVYNRHTCWAARIEASNIAASADNHFNFQQDVYYRETDGSWKRWNPSRTPNWQPVPDMVVPKMFRVQAIIFD